MVGLEFNHAPGSGFASAVTAACMEKGLLLLTTGWRETIRFIPPLIVSSSEMDQALDIFESALLETISGWTKATKGYYSINK
jgi:4-aminobutyrate aminotransferase